MQDTESDTPSSDRAHYYHTYLVFYQKCAPKVQLSKPHLTLSAQGEENGHGYISNKPEQSLTPKRCKRLIALPV